MSFYHNTEINQWIVQTYFKPGNTGCNTIAIYVCVAFCLALSIIVDFIFNPQIAHFRWGLIPQNHPLQRLFSPKTVGRVTQRLYWTSGQILSNRWKQGLLKMLSWYVVVILDVYYRCCCDFAPVVVGLNCAVKGMKCWLLQVWN